MKKNKQGYVLLIILFLAVVSFFYYSYKFKFLEGLSPDDQEYEEELMDDEEELMDDEEELMDDEEGPIDDPKEKYSIKNKGKRGVKAMRDINATTSKSSYAMTGEYIPMKNDNKNSLTSVVENLEKDFDSAIPRMSKKISSIENSMANFESSLSAENNKTPTKLKQIEISHSTDIKKNITSPKQQK